VHPAFFSIGGIALIAPLCVVGAIIGTQLIVTLGITANTSLIGALAGMGLARIPLLAFARYRSIHMQNLAQSAISASTFGAGNALLLPIGCVVSGNLFAQIVAPATGVASVPALGLLTSNPAIMVGSNVCSFWEYVFPDAGNARVTQLATKTWDFLNTTL